jgi:hypothetical protein
VAYFVSVNLSDGGFLLWTGESGHGFRLKSINKSIDELRRSHIGYPKDITSDIIFPFDTHHTCSFRFNYLPCALLV